VETIPLSDIKISSAYLRVDTDVSTLIQSIKQIGLINPLTVNEANELIAGGRRYTALRALEFTDVPINRISLENALEHELISIDENLIRKPLSKIELETCLNRGREIYELLNPEANKIEIEQRDLSSSEKKAEKEKEELDHTSFAAVTAEKTGLSKASIKTAIKREVLSADSVKDARSNGSINAGQTNEIIRLEKEEQEKVLPYVQGATTKEVRKLVDAVKREGLETAIAKSTEIERVPKELAQVRSYAKTVNRNLKKMLQDGIGYGGPQREKIREELEELSQNLADVLTTLQPPLAGPSTPEPEDEGEIEWVTLDED
jgi:ParB family transcriptional regulator, chromosome partitioning protein